MNLLRAIAEQPGLYIIEGFETYTPEHVRAARYYVDETGEMTLIRHRRRRLAR